MWASLQSAVLLIVVFSDFGSTIQTCQTGVKKFEIFDEQVNWFAALFKCHTQGMTLATIENREEQERLVDQLKRESCPEAQPFCNKSWWLGGSDLHNTGEYVWISTGQNITYTNFRQYQPDNRIFPDGEEEHCLALVAQRGWQYKWNDGVCTSHRTYICEYFQQSE